MIWKFKPVKAGTAISIKNREGRNYKLGTTEPENTLLMINRLLTYIQEGEIISMDGLKETIVYKSPKGRTLTRTWNHTSVIYPGQKGELNN